MENKNITQPIEDKNIDVMTPWCVKGKVNYLEQITKFGTSPVNGALIERWERVTKTKAHPFMRRGLVFSHQDIDKILDSVEAGIPVYLYTGRGPSSESMHLGHMVPFRLTQYLQQALNCIAVIQMSDDEKFFFKDGSTPKDLDNYRKCSYLNAKDIIACGFDVNKTFIFSNLETNGGDLYFNNVLIMKATSMASVKSTFGLGEVLPKSVLDILQSTLEKEQSSDSPNQLMVDDIKGTLKKFSGESSSSVGECSWPCFQSSPAFCTSFKQIFIRALEASIDEKDSPQASMRWNGEQHVLKSRKKVLKELKTLGASQSMMCFVPMAIDQSPYFRGARDVASTLGCPKPAVIHSEFLPGLKQSSGSKMSTTGDNSATLFLDIDPKKISKMIKSHAFSGGKDTLEDHQLYGGDIRIDICYQYLTYFMDSDEELQNIAQEYTSGRMTSGQLKDITANIISGIIAQHQERRKKIDDTVLATFFNPNRTLHIGGCYGYQDIDMSQYVNYNNYGIDFDRTFGMSCKNVPAKQVDEAQVDEAQVDEAQVDEAQVDEAQVDEAQVDEDDEDDEEQVDEPEFTNSEPVRIIMNVSPNEHE
jgi:tryptophanyl-tRNA synthetase